MEMAKPLQSLIDEITNCHLTELPGKLKSNMEWNRPRGDLYHWISVLNRFDDIFEAQIKKYQLDQEFVKLSIMSSKDSELVSTCLTFTFMLLEHCANRAIYKGSERIAHLINTPTLPVRLSALQVSVALSERRLHNNSKILNEKELKEKLLLLISSYPPLVPGDFKPLKNEGSNAFIFGGHYSYRHTLKVDAQIPESWKSINFHYYKNQTIKMDSSPSKLKSPKKAGTHENLCTFSISSENVRKLSIEQIFDKANEVIPKSLWFEFALHAQVTKSLNSNDHDSIIFRENLLMCKLYSICFIVNSSKEDYVSAKIFEVEPYMLGSLVGFIMAENIDNYSHELIFSVIKAFECFSIKRYWGGEIIRSLGANVNHGAIYQTLKHIHKKLLNQDPNCYHKAYIHLFNMIGNLIENHTLRPRLAMGGILNELMNFLQQPSKYRWEASAAVHLITSFLSNSSSSLNEFINNNGFPLMIDTIGEEVNFALENPGFDGGPPEGSVVQYTISFRQANFLRNLMKLVTYLIQWESGDRLRNLFDSPILQSFNKILVNPKVFGPSILSSTIDAVFYIIHNEPTAFSILNEAKVIDTILDNFDDLMLPNSDLIVSLPEVLGAISLNKEGIKKVESKNCFASFFRIFSDPKLCRDLVNSGMANNLGGSFDELGRHYPSLKPIIIEQVKKLVREAPKLVNENIQGPKNYSPSESEKTIENWETSDYGNIFEAISLFFRALLQEGNWGNEIVNAIKFEEWLPFFDLPNAPYDFVLSNFNYNIVELLTYFDEDDIEYSFPVLVKYLKEKFNDEAIKTFMNYQGESSFFSQSNYTADDFTMIYRQLNSVTNLLFALSNGYFKWGVISHDRYYQLADIFGSDDGLEFLTNLGKILSRIIIEENYLRTNCDEQIAIESTATPDSAGENPKIRILMVEPESQPRHSSERKDYLFKNILQVRTICFNLSHSISDLFNYVSKVMHRRQEYAQSEWRRKSVKITTTLAVIFKDLLDVEIKDSYQRNCYYFVTISILLYVISQRDPGKNIVQTSLIVAMLDKKVFHSVGRIGCSIFDELLHLPDVPKQQLNYTKHTIDSIDRSTLSHISKIFARITVYDNFPSLPNANYFYHNTIEEKFDVISSAIGYSRSIAIDLLSGTIEKFFTNPTPDQFPSNIPLQVIKDLVGISSVIINDYGTTSQELFVPLDWKNVSPPYDQIEYLKSLGMVESKAIHYFKHAKDLQPLMKGDWPCPSSSYDKEDLENISGALKNDNKQFVNELQTVDCSKKLRSYPVRDTDSSEYSRFFESWFNVASAYPQVSDTLAESVSMAEDGQIPVFVSKNLEADAEIRNKFVHSHLGLVRSILSFIMKDNNISLTKDTYIPICKIVVDLVRENNQVVNEEFIAEGLLIVEQALTYQSIPKQEVFDHKWNEVIKDTVLIDENQQTQLLESLTSVETFTNASCASAIIKILTVLCMNQEKRVSILQSSLIAKLIQASVLFTNNTVEPTKKDQQGLVVLLRRCFESPEVIKYYMNSQLKQILQRQKNRKQLSALLKECGNLPLRDADVFTELMAEKIRFFGYDGEQDAIPRLLPVVAAPNSKQEDIEMIESDKTHSQPSIQPSSIIHTIISEIIKTSRKDIWSNPKEETTGDKPQETKPHENKNNKLMDVFKNQDFTYICFLLQTLTELLGSYMHAKLEFITFSKKENYTENVKPRSTALNVLLHQLIPTQPLSTASGIESDRRSAISSITKIAILALISTPVLDETNDPKPRKENGDMAFIRNFCTDVILKSMRDTFNSGQSNQTKYGKLIDLYDLIGSLVSNKLRQISGPLLDKNASKMDSFYISRCLIDKQVPNQITSSLASFDLNFPGIEKVVKAAVHPLGLLAKLKSENQENYDDQGEKDDEIPDSEDDDDEREEEEGPDLFRNSTLGMYDIEYDSEDEMDYFDDEGEDLEVLMSGEEVVSDENSEGDDEDDDEGDDSDDMDDIEDDGDEDLDDEDLDDASMADSYYHGHDVEIIDENASDYDDSDIEIIDTTAVGLDEGDGSEFYFEDSQGEDAESSEYSEGELDGWIEEFGDESEDEDEEHDRANHNDEDMDDGRIIIDEEGDLDGDSDGDSIAEEDFDGVGIASSSRRAQGEMATSFFDALRPHMNRGNTLANIFSGILGNNNTTQGNDGIFRGTIQLGNVDVANGVPRFERAIESILEIAGKPDDRSVDPLSNLYIESTLERWNESMTKLRLDKKEEFLNYLAGCIGDKIVEDSIALEKKRQDKVEELIIKREEKRRQKEDERMKKEEQKAQELAAEVNENDEQQEPVMVRIGDREVDISGTEIDPEFFEALPDDMREEVFTQHVRDRRAHASTTGANSREIDPDFLNALPEQIREEILQQESMARYSTGRDEDDEDDFEESEDDFHDHNESIRSGDGSFHNAFQDLESENKSEPKKPEEKPKKNKKLFFTPLIDRSGAASLLRLLFIPQPLNKREGIHQSLKYLCLNKHTRIEVLNLIVFVLQDGLLNNKSFEKSYNHLGFKAFKTEGDAPKVKSILPLKATIINIGNQMVDLLHYLLEENKHMRYYFITEHDNPYTKNKKSKLSIGKADRYQINSLLRLLENQPLRDDQPFMDVLSRVLQLITKSLDTFKRHKDDKSMLTPYVPDYLLSQMVKFLTSYYCPNTTFRRAISAMQNLGNCLDNAQRIFSIELSDQATNLGQVIISDLNKSIDEIRIGSVTSEEDLKLVKFNDPSSDQSKLLRVLTALDYMYESKNKKAIDDVEELTELYKKLALGSLWDALSDALRALEENPKLTDLATILLPLIESLMVVCKHSKVKELQVKDAVKYQAKKIDFTKEPIESLFFSFTDEHKKILNQMVRTNPNLMSGPFAMLVRNPKVLEFDNKKNYFDRRLHESSPKDPKTLAINIRRDQVFLDSYRALFFKTKEEFRESKLEINFKGESGIDAGGVTREWYQVLSRQMFNPDYALFTPVSSDENTYHPNRISYINPEHLSFFKFIGKIIGKAIFDNCFLDCHFSRAVYKRLLGRKVSLKDMETLDLEYFKSLVWMLENDITDVITEDFSVETDDYGEKKIIDLIPDGRNIPVTEENKQEYVRLVVEYRLQTSVTEQMDNFLMGFHEIIPKDIINIFDEQELELLISGLPDIDVNDWQNNTSYSNYSASSIQIQWFWRAVKSFDNEERAKLLQFATGTSKVPLNGFKELSSVNGTCKFSIHRDYGSLDRLPSSHTCFNQIDLPAYETYETLRGSLLLAITEGHEGFGLA
ncbi:E3 ubiquitin-protein ligase Tom1p [[Candida] jaroonii]|uniref:E3 ubiquitin-protein ligase Tom1p n=1 Tax=[Candida] jaroonii TaxID=467808 RepID=A0ACA9Y0R8_9ASCO|nr:E3 ubiquitin-protein ligase Tom1p [[Candida] jaroonii]